MQDKKIIYYVHKRIRDEEFAGDNMPVMRIYVKDKVQRKLISKLTHKWFLTMESMKNLESMGYEFRQYMSY